MMASLTEILPSIWLWKKTGKMHQKLGKYGKFVIKSFISKITIYRLSKNIVYKTVLETYLTFNGLHSFVAVGI